MNIEELEQKIKGLEKRVGELKDFKVMYERDQKVWDKERAELKKSAAAALKLKDSLQELLGPEPPSVTLKRVDIPRSINLDHEEVTVNITHREKVINLNTSTVNGKIFYCAVNDLPPEGFIMSEISEKMAEYGWNVGNNTLAPSLGGLVKTGDLVRIDGTKPARYKIPGKIKVSVSTEGG